MYYAVTRTNELQHHGIKGMKWGVRRYQNADGSYTSIGKSHRKKYYAQEAHNMSDEDLRKANERLSLEKQYKDLVSKSTMSASEIFNKASAKTDNVSSKAKDKFGKKSKERKAVSDISKAFKKAANVSDKAADARARKKVKNANLDSLSDKELRDKVNRLRAEQQYTSLKYEKQGKAKLDKLFDHIDTIGDVTTIGIASYGAYKFAKPIVTDLVSKYGEATLFLAGTAVKKVFQY